MVNPIIKSLFDNMSLESLISVRHACIRICKQNNEHFYAYEALLLYIQEYMENTYRVLETNYSTGAWQINLNSHSLSDFDKLLMAIFLPHH